MPASDLPRIGFVLERSLGHTTHAANLARLLPTNPSIRADLCEIPYDVVGAPARVPVYSSNWTVRAGIRASRAIARMRAQGRLDALFVHTQVPAVLSQWCMAIVPTVVSLDATPLQYDELGEHYDHETGGERAEKLKYRLNRSCLHRAVHVVTWSKWAAAGVVDGYGVSPEHITVIPPGVTPSLWFRPVAADESDTVRILFVGGDLARKGGDTLLRAFDSLVRQAAEVPRSPALELHLVTRSPVQPRPGVVVHNGLGPNSPKLVSLYHRSHIFCLPTRGDCLPMVLSEAGAAGLPSVSTCVAGIPEIVRDGETGLVVPVDDSAALTQALRTLVYDRDLRLRLGGAAQRLVAEEFDADKNARRLVDVVLEKAAVTRRPTS
jgi:glycosyltransferase involved in cell wall biosynthesis